MELDKAYEPKRFEDDIYARWEKSGLFNPDNLTGEPFSVMMPPPNVTGVLHLGHALENTLMDTMVRFERMQGKKVLLVPGTDHAAVATQAKVEKILKEQGVEHPREELGREALLEKIREFAEGSKKTILSQVRKMGTSCDWSRLAYTFDDVRSRAVNDVFVKMYNDGLIYRGYRVVNWSVKGQSTCSDDELVHVERPAKMYTFRYGKDFPIMIATTRPETKLGDTAVAVHPSDERYQKYIGQTFTVDVGAERPLMIRVIADENVDPNFGVGALGVTPAHSQIDFEMYEKQKAAGTPIDFIQVIGNDGRMTTAAGENYAGLTVVEAREKFVAWLRENNLLEKEEDIVQNVGTSDRFGDVVEAVPMTQWFVAVNKEIPGRGKTLKDLMREAVTVGHNHDPEQKVRITPERFENIYLQWIDNLRDWCISRQIWWGHRIPVWYRKDEIFCGTNAPQGEGWQQDDDTLDTWFSSGLWTFSTLGWPDKTKDFDDFHPTNWMQMGHEILFFWMARMILMSTYALDQIPFRDVYIHGILRDEHGKKFSKSAGNGIDPIDVINEYGCDALRYSVISGITPGNDSRFYNEKIEGARNLVNKIWNICRYMLLNIESPRSDIGRPVAVTVEDQWILVRLDTVIERVTAALHEYNFSAAAEELRVFTWSDLADWYLEAAKVHGQKSDMLNYLLNAIIKLWHPYLPFVTETIWQQVYGSSFLMVQPWPQPILTDGERREMGTSEYVFEKVRQAVIAVRKMKTEYQIVKAEQVSIIEESGATSLRDFAPHIERLGGIKEGGLVFSAVEASERTATYVSGVGDVVLILTGQIDVEKEKARIQKEIDTVAPYAASLEKKLSNEQFVQNAPAAVVDGERRKLAEAQDKLHKLQEQISAMS